MPASSWISSILPVSPPSGGAEKNKQKNLNFFVAGFVIER
jgi:hypothetical protein